MGATWKIELNVAQRLLLQGAARKSSRLMVFANFSAVVPEFKVKFGTLV